jgi:uncharacterized protein YdiU (UPF0061 family)
MKIPTTRGLAAVFSSENVYRENVLPGGIFTRVASSHIRIGTFQYFSAKNDLINLNILLKYSIERHYPEILKETIDVRYYPLLFLRKVIHAQLNLVTSWMSIGFIHGVMNTDNMSISGETLDYGPCAFMDYFDFQQVYSFIDRNGRYSFINQANILSWNLARLADSLMNIVIANFGIDEENAKQLLEKELIVINEQFEVNFTAKMSKKLGLNQATFSDLDVKELIAEFFHTLQLKKLDYTSSFRKLSKGLVQNEIEADLVLFYTKWKGLLISKKLNLELVAREMDAVNPIYIPRNHLVQRMIDKAISNDYSMFDFMIKVFLNPFESHAEFDSMALPPLSHEIVQNTFCGT